MSIEAEKAHLIRCDHCTDLGLGTEACWQDWETDAPMQFGDAEQALDFVRSELVKNEGWTTDGEHCHCVSCSKLRPLVDPNPEPEPIPVLRGQIPLGADA
jgi:hypothetical protein